MHCKVIFVRFFMTTMNFFNQENFLIYSSCTFASLLWSVHNCLQYGIKTQTRIAKNTANGTHIWIWIHIGCKMQFDLLTSDSAEFMLQLGENDQGKSKYCCKESKGKKREPSRVPVLDRQQHHDEQPRTRRAVKSSGNDSIELEEHTGLVTIMMSKAPHIRDLEWNPIAHDWMMNVAQVRSHNAWILIRFNPLSGTSMQ